MVFTFSEYYQTSIDGDVLPVVFPMESHSQILHDPFGLDALLKGDRYSGAGRWFCHAVVYSLFHEGYSFITTLVADRIKALFLTASIFQWINHWMMTCIIALYANISHKSSWKRFLFGCVLTIPFFQYNHGYYNAAIIDHSVTYTAFYAFPLSLLLLFFYPFFRSLFFPNPLFLSNISLFGIIFLGICVAFSGPLIPVIGIMVSGILLLLYYQKAINNESFFEIASLSSRIKNIPSLVKGMLIPFIIICAYDFYIGRFNIENVTTVTIAERYQLMLKGLIPYFFHYGLPYFYAFLIINFYFFKKFFPVQFNTRSFGILKLLALTVLIYIILVPLGGYRVYRPAILRYDVTMPLTLLLVITIVSGTSLLMDKLQGQALAAYSGISLVLLAVLWYQNLPINNSRKEQESMLRILSRANTDSVIVLPYSANFFSWEKISTPEKSYYVRQMLYDWGITKKPVVFYQK